MQRIELLKNLKKKKNRNKEPEENKNIINKAEGKKNINKKQNNISVNNTIINEYKKEIERLQEEIIIQKMKFSDELSANGILIGQYKCILKAIMIELKKKRIKVNGLNFIELL